MLGEKLMEDILDSAVRGGGDFAEVFDEDCLFMELKASNEKVESSSEGRESGVGVRIFKGNKCFYGCSNDKSERSLKELVTQLTAGMRASHAAGKGHRGGGVKLTRPVEYRMGGGAVRLSGMDMTRRMEAVRRALGAGMEYDSGISRMWVKRTDFEQKVQIANSEGLCVTDERIKTRLYIEAFAMDDLLGTESGYFGPGAMKGEEYYQEIDVEAMAKEAARRAMTVLRSEKCPGGQMSVVVDHGFGGLLFHEACGHSLEASCIARNASEFCGKLGEKVGSDLITLIDDGTMPGEWGGFHVDDEGSPASRNVLIENGILRSYMVDRLDGMRMGMKPTGNARRQNYRFPPVSRMTNTYIAPGKSTPQEIISNTESGIYVKSITGGSVEPATGDFNFATGECWLIENGRVTVPVKGATLIGNGGAVLRNVDMVASDYELRQGYCYAGSGALFIGAGQPTIRISNMTVGGIK